MLVHSIRAIKIRTTPSWIVLDRGTFLKPMTLKGFFALVGKLFQFLLFIDVCSQFRTTAKNGGENSFFQLFSVYLKTRFREIKERFSPFFFETVGPIGLEMFLQVLAAHWGACFFLLEILFLSNLAGLAKFRWSKKHWFFDKVFNILLLLTSEGVIFGKDKKYALQFGSGYHAKSFCSNGWATDFCEWGTFRHFRPLWSPKLREGSIWESRFYDELCSTHRDLSILRVS